MTIRVFLADDHTVVRDGLEHLLNRQPDIDVVGRAGDGQAAVDGVRAVRPDVAVLDIGMPSLSGIAAAARIRETCPETEVVILSMHGSQEHVTRAVRAGVRGYVLKEGAGSELVEAVRAAHRGRQWLCAGAAEALVSTVMEGAEEEQKHPLAALSDRERQVFRLVVQGMTSAEIGERFSLSPKTIETYRSRIHRKLGTDDVVDLVKFAVRHDLVSLD